MQTLRTPDDLPSPPWPGASCVDADDPSLWFSDDPADQAAARAICVLCPVVHVCREWGRREPYGTWGALTEQQRTLAGLTLSAARWCTVCGDQLPDGSRSSICPTTDDRDCYRQRSISVRKQSRAEQSASRSCIRCQAFIWPQARSCLVCGHDQRKPLPDRPWPPPARIIGT